MKAEHIQLLTSVLMAIGVFFAVLFFLPDESLDGPGGPLARRRERRGIFLKLFFPAIVALGQLIAVLPLGQTRAKLKIKLIQAGSPGGLSADEFFATRILSLAFIGAAGFYFDSELKTDPIFFLVGLFLGWFYPNIWLKGLIEKRQRQIFRDLPDLLDTLRLAVDAGLDLGSAMKVVVEKGKRGALLEELETVESEMTLGRTRKEAFKNFADRIAMTEINAFVLALMQADQLGASVGPILRVQSQVARTRRWQLAEALVNKMPMKMLGPLVVFIFPASFIILFTPLVIQWMQSE